MLTPPPVNGQSYPTLFTAGERSNYLRGGMAFIAHIRITYWVQSTATR